MGGGNTRALLKRKLKTNTKPGVGFHEIIAVTEMGTDKAVQKPRMNFVLAQRKKRQRKTNISGPQQMCHCVGNLTYTQCSWKQILPLWNYFCELRLACWSGNLTLISLTTLCCWTVTQFPFFQDFLDGQYFFPLCRERIKIMRGILDQVHVPVAIVFHGDLPRILCQRDRLTASHHCSLILGLQVTGQRATGWSCQLCSSSKSKHTHRHTM